MANINYRGPRWRMARRLLRYVADGLIHVGSAWLLLPPPPLAQDDVADADRGRNELARNDTGTETFFPGAPPAGHPERLVPGVAPTGAERLLWRQLEDRSR